MRVVRGVRGASAFADARVIFANVRKFPYIFIQVNNNKLYRIENQVMIVSKSEKLEVKYPSKAQLLK